MKEKNILILTDVDNQYISAFKSVGTLMHYFVEGNIGCAVSIKLGRDNLLEPGDNTEIYVIVTDQGKFVSDFKGSVTVSHLL